MPYNYCQISLDIWLWEWCYSGVGHYENQVNNGLLNRVIISHRWLDRVITDGNLSNCFIFIVLKKALKENLRRCMFISPTPISSGLWSSLSVDSESLNILMSLSVLRFALTFFISAVSVCCLLPRLQCLLTCYNNVIDAGQNNRLFAPGTDMDRALLRLSHIQKGT